MARTPDDSVWLPAICEHGNPNTSGIARIARIHGYWYSPGCTNNGLASGKMRPHKIGEDAPADNRLVPARKPRKQRSDKGKKRGARS